MSGLAPEKYRHPGLILATHSVPHIVASHGIIAYRRQPASQRDHVLTSKAEACQLTFHIMLSGSSGAKCSHPSDGNASSDDVGVI